MAHTAEVQVPDGAPASPVRPNVLASSRCPLLTGTADGALQPFGQLPVAVGADGPLRVAVRGGGQGDRHVPVGVRADDDLPSEVLAADQPPRTGYRASGHREGVVAHRGVAEARFGRLAPLSPEPGVTVRPA